MLTPVTFPTHAIVFIKTDSEYTIKRNVTERLEHEVNISCVEVGYITTVGTITEDGWVQIRSAVTMMENNVIGLLRQMFLEVLTAVRYTNKLECLVRLAPENEAQIENLSWLANSEYLINNHKDLVHEGIGPGLDFAKTIVDVTSSVCNYENKEAVLVAYRDHNNETSRYGYQIDAEGNIICPFCGSIDTCGVNLCIEYNAITIDQDERGYRSTNYIDHQHTETEEICFQCDGCYKYFEEDGSEVIPHLTLEPVIPEGES